MQDKAYVNQKIETGKIELRQLVDDGNWLEAAYKSVEMLNTLYGHLDEGNKIDTALKCIKDLKCLSCTLDTEK
jgi:hypothetical protein